MISERSLVLLSDSTMPKRKGRQVQLAANAKKGREAIKNPRLPDIDEESPAQGPSVRVQELQIEEGRGRSVSTDPTDEDPTFDPEEAKASDPTLKLEQFVEEWVLSLDCDDKIALGLFLTYNLQHTLNFTATRSAEYAAIMMGKSERTIRQWRSDFLANGEILQNKQGRYQRQGILWSSEELNKKASEYIRADANVKGQPNLTAAAFCFWVNEELLPNACLEPGFP